MQTKKNDKRPRNSFVKKELLMEMYKKMFRIRKFEEKIEQLDKRGVLPGLKHVYIGEEAVAVGVVSALNESDLILSTHRGHGHCIAKGADVKKMMAELYGKRTGYCHGKSGSMHITSLDIGMLGANGIVGANIPIAGGAALAAKMRGEKQVVVSFFGDGAMNTGAFHEGLNLASLWKVPAIFICENNLYAISVAQSRSTSIANVFKRADAYGMPGECVNGMDVESVYEETKKAVRRARDGLGPSFIECRTYRFYGHYLGEGSREREYRSKGEVDSWKEKDPLHLLQSKLREMHQVRAQDLVDLEALVEREIEEAVKFAEDSPYPDPEEVWDDLFFKGEKY